MLTQNRPRTARIAMPKGLSGEREGEGLGEDEIGLDFGLKIGLDFRLKLG